MGRTRNLRDVEANNEEKPANWRDWVLVFLWSFLGYMCIILTVLTYYNPGILPFDVTSVLFRKEISPFFAFSQGSNHYSKPKGFKIVALVPFTDHEPTSILDCYLQVRHIASLSWFYLTYPRKIWFIMMDSLTRLSL